MYNVSEILRKARKAKHLTLNELSVCTGIPARTLGSYERNERNPFGASFGSFCILCNSLCLSLDDMAYLATCDLESRLSSANDSDSYSPYFVDRNDQFHVELL